jgi:hypothetical protein
MSISTRPILVNGIVLASDDLPAMRKVLHRRQDGAEVLLDVLFRGEEGERISRFLLQARKTPQRETTGFGKEVNKVGKLDGNLQTRM